MIVVFLQHMLKEKLLIFLINTLLLHIPLLALTDRQNDRQRNKLIRVGLGNLRFLQVNLEYIRKERTLAVCAWAGGTFFPVVLLVVSVFGSGGK
jgi:hypothetical protein